jgi:hypothetical protein
VSFDTASRNGEPFEEVIKKYGLPGAGGYMHCTRELKANPIRDYAMSLGEHQMAIGIRVDEIDRIFGLIPDHATVIVVNWWAWDTILGDHAWDHVTTVDADLFDRLSNGWNVRVRNGSHLVLGGRS